MEPIFLHDWKNADEVFADFEDSFWSGAPNHPIDNKEEIEILLASYTYENYEGYAFVLFRDKTNGKLYEVNGGHCSCYGLEGQWEPDETSIESLEHRLNKGTLGMDGWYDNRNIFANELRSVLAELKKEAK